MLNQDILTNEIYSNVAFGGGGDGGGAAPAALAAGAITTAGTMIVESWD